MILAPVTTSLLGLAVTVVLATVASYVSHRRPVVPYPVAPGGSVTPKKATPTSRNSKGSPSQVGLCPFL